MFTIQKDLYCLTCEMHAELWRLERMRQTYIRSRFYIRVATGKIADVVTASLDHAKPFINCTSILPDNIMGELADAARILFFELQRIDRIAYKHAFVEDFKVDHRLFDRYEICVKNIDCKLVGV